MLYRLSTLLMLLVLLAACGGQPAVQVAEPTSAPAAQAPTAAPAATEAPAATPATTTTPAEPTTPAASDAGFPVTLEHSFGSTTISAVPQRVISLGYSDQDALLALGVQPIAVRKWFGEPKYGVWEWAQDELGSATPEVLEMQIGGLNFEALAALKPDLIVAISAALTDAEYATLTKIAPVVAMPEGYPTMLPWQEHTRIVGQAVGQSSRAEEVIADVETWIASARAAHPEFAGKTVVVAEYLDAGSYYIFDPQNPQIEFLKALGLEMTEATKELHANGTAGGTISGERIDLLEADLLIWSVPTAAERQALEALPLYQQLDVAREQRATFLTYNEEPNIISAALSFGTVLSIPYLLDTFVPQIATVVGGESTAASAAAGATHTVTDDLGRTVTIPAQPQRVVALQDLQVLRPLLDLGITPIASVTHPRSEGVFRFVDEYDVSGVEVIGLMGEPNMEQLVLLKPDLIIGTLSAGTDAQLDTLSQIAPTVVYNAGRPVIEYHRSLAEAVGALDAYDALMADYETRLATLKDGLAPIRDELVVSLLAFNPNAAQIEIGEGPYTLVLRGADIHQPEPQVNFESADEGVRRYWISLEKLPEHDADVIFLLYSNDPSVNAPITDSPIWGQLAAVKAGQVVEVDGSTWYVQSVRSLFSVIDALEQHLVATEVDTRVVE